MTLWLEWTVRDELEALLEESRHLRTLAFLYASKGLQKRALDIWRIMAERNLTISLQGSSVMWKRGRESTGFTHDQLAAAMEAARLLEESSDHKLVLEHLTWIIEMDQDLVVKVLTSSKRSSPLPPGEKETIMRIVFVVRPVCPHVQSNAKSLCLKYRIRSLCKESILEKELHIQILHITSKPIDSCKYVHLFQDCIRRRAFVDGKRIHSDMYMNEKESIFVADRYLQNTLINMYVECGSLKDARGVFDQMLDRNVVSWTAMISGYAKQDLPEDDALSLFWKTQGAGIER